ncbi:MAG: glycosyltransferase family 4 protein [Candidatus Cloacimonetes bacterium]|nr:glycosyltransferase family 4 protein [Candidatus Cloacimonadota bacterium]
MNIGIIIGRIGDIDGVALETEKWVKVLKKMGHSVYILSGNFKRSIVGDKNESVWRALSFFSPECEWEQNRAFFFPEFEQKELIDHLDDTSNEIATHIFKWILKKKIEVILTENNTSLPCHLSMGMGIKKVVQNSSLPVVAHNHDFYWERGDRYKSPHKKILKIMEDTFPLILPNVRHAVINTYSKDIFKKKFGINAMIVPNVMDFNKPFARRDSYNNDLLADLGMDKKDIPIFQITRIVRRKGIEVAIEMVHKLQDKRIKLIVTGSAADDSRKGYYKELLVRIKERKLDEQVLFGHRCILSERGKRWHGRKIYSLSDAYANAVACTYFSTYEGFGNAFIECVLAKRPVFVNNYKPVYWPDIGSKGFKTVMLEDNILTNKALEDIERIIHNKKEQEDIAEHNYKIGKKHFSYKVLEEKLEELFKF